MKSVIKLMKAKGHQLDYNPRLMKILFFFSNYSQKIFEIHPGRRNPIGEESESNQIENKNIETVLFKSIDNSRNNIAFLNYVPLTWVEKDLKEHFDREEERILKITIVKNRLGNPTGKALLEFKSETLCDEFIKKWNDNFIETKEFTQKIMVRAFNLKKHSEKAVAKNKHKTVYLRNIDFDATVDDIYKMASDFGEIINMDLPIKRGKNMGYGFVNFRTSEDAENFQQFADERLFMGRKLSAQINEYKYDTQKKTYTKKSDRITEHLRPERGLHHKEALNLYNELLLDDEIKIDSKKLKNN